MMEYLVSPWAWVVFAVVLGGAEILLSGYLMLGLALAAIGVAAQLALGLISGPVTALLVFGALSILAWGVIWLIFGRSGRGAPSKDVNDFSHKG